MVAAAITELYRVRGYAQAAVKAGRPGVAAKPPTPRSRTGRWRFVSRSRKARRPSCRALTVEGTTAIPAETLKAQLALAAGRPFYRPQLAVDREAIDRAYRNQGFQNVSVISQAGRSPHGQRQVAITWTVREGDQITIDRILINGNSRIATTLIQRELTIQPGSPISDDAMLESQRRLAELGLFRRVRITELPRTGSLTRDVLVDARRSRPRRPSTTAAASRSAASAGRDDEGFAIDELDIGAARLLRDQPAELVGQEPLGDAVWPRHAQARPEDGHGRRLPRPTGRGRRAATASTTTVGCSRSASRAPSAPPATRSSPPSSSRRRRTSFCFNRKGLTSDYARRIARDHRHRPLHLRLHESLRRGRSRSRISC